MDIDKFYDNIVLRDIVEYLTPGAIFLFSVVLLAEATLRGIGSNISPLNSMSTSGFLGFVIMGLAAYVFGHFITGLYTWLFRDKESEQIVDVLRKDEVLRSQIIHTISDHLKIPEPQVQDMLKDPRKANEIRQIGRALIYHRMQPLYREFVGRLSILSRFHQNMTVSLTLLLISAIASIILDWREIENFTTISPFISTISLILIVTIIVLSILIFVDRSRRLRRNMIRYTFQVWLADSVISQLEQEKGEKSKDQEMKSSKMESIKP